MPFCTNAHTQMSKQPDVYHTHQLGDISPIWTTTKTTFIANANATFHKMSPNEPIVAWKWSDKEPPTTSRK